MTIRDLIRAVATMTGAPERAVATSFLINPANVTALRADPRVRLVHFATTHPKIH